MTHSRQAEQQAVQGGTAAAFAGRNAPEGRAVAVRTISATPVGGPAAKTVTIDGEEYPDPLRLNNGDSVTTAAEWEDTRRAELLADFRQNVYGQGLPDPTAQTFQVTSTDFPGVTRKIVKVTVACSQATGSFDVTLFVPKTDGKPRGTFLMIDHRGAVGDDRVGRRATRRFRRSSRPSR